LLLPLPLQLLLRFYNFNANQRIPFSFKPA